MKTVLMVAEKPSLALSIAKILSNNSCNTRKGASSSCAVHEYTGTFQRESVRFKMTSVCGHVMALDFKGYFNNWDSVEPIELFDASTRKKEAMENLHIPKHLEQEGKGIDFLVLWLDCDKEGENICFEVIDCVKPVMKSKAYNEQAVYRAHFSAITDKDIKKAMQNLGEPNKNEALSVDARQELDLRIGCAFTRFQTRFFQGKYGNLDSSLISFGPCQTPTLGFCVDRHDQIQTFKPETYWKLQITIKPGFQVDWDRVRVFDKEIANVFLNLVKAEKNAKVVSIKEKEKTKQRPQALNTVELLRVASSALGIGPQQTMHFAEKLYIQGYISYPRTETTHYSENFDITAPLRQQSSSSSWGEHVRDLLKTGYTKPRKGADAGDHPPITPMKAASYSELSGDAWRVYEYIVQHFIGTVSPDCVYKQKVITFLINGEKFTCEGKTVTKPGFTAVMPWQAIPQGESLPHLSENQTCEIQETKLVDKQTSPPDYLTEAELITLMEKHGIGTDASIPVHMNNICQRNYVTIESGRRLVPTPLGIVLVHGYKKIDPQLVLPTMRAAVEKQLNLIANGKADYRAVLRHSIDIFERKFDYFMKHIDNMDQLFECSFTKLSETGKPMTRCGKCRRYMKYIDARPYRLHCSTCEETYNLPQDGFVKLFQELKCPLDEFELLLWSKDGNSKSYPLCPNCYTTPPFKDMNSKSGCNQCTHPTCKHSSKQLTVAECPFCESGVIVLEPFTAPKWRMSCNKCSSCWTVCKTALKILISTEKCDQCQGALLDVTFPKEKTPLPDGRTKIKGCPMCDSAFVPMVKNISSSDNTNRPFGNRGRGRGRGASRGGRGGTGSRGAARRGGGRGSGERGGGERGGRGGGGRGRRGRGRGGSRDDDDESYARPKATHNLADFLNF